MSAERTVWAYCIHCGMPCEAFTDGKMVDWYTTCACPWQNDDIPVSAQALLDRDKMDERAREAWRSSPPDVRGMLL